jgi:RNA polymerase sigma-70 factor (sigma-E family)
VQGAAIEVTVTVVERGEAGSMRAVTPSRTVSAAADVVAALHLAHYRSLVRMAVLLVDSESCAEEVVQDAFLKLMRRWSTLRDVGSAEAYLRRTVVNGARDQLRSRRVRRLVRMPTVAPASSADEPVMREETSRQLIAALAALPPRQREVLVLRYFSELSERQVADCLAVSVGTVKSSAHRGLVALRTALEEADR